MTEATFYLAHGTKITGVRPLLTRASMSDYLQANRDGVAVIHDSKKGQTTLINMKMVCAVEITDTP